MCISDETFDKIREAWARGIPPQYRFTGKDRSTSPNISDRHFSSAIILPMPPVAILERWLSMICKPHLTKDQLEVLKRGPQAQRNAFGERYK